MPTDKSPVFRKAIIPWYHSRMAYIIVIASMLLVFLFSMAGISVAREHPEYQNYIWVPISLVVMSGGIIITTTVRLVKRYSKKSSK
jgi:hypothetical protein